MDIDLSKYRKTILDFKADIMTPDKSLNFASASVEESMLDPDLMFVYFKLCHEGANSNGDTFTKDVLKNSYVTCMNKPLDIEHDQPVIGVMTDSAYGEEADGTGYIECVGVVWKFIYPEYAQEIREKAMSGELKISMECYFKDANYMVGNTIYDEQTAVKMGLNNYVGREYMGMKVTRVFNEAVIFGGAGVVKNPADKGAVFLAVASDKKEQMNKLMDKMNKLMEASSDEEKEQMKYMMKKMIASLENIDENTEIALNQEEKEVSVRVADEPLHNTSSSLIEDTIEEIINNPKGSEVKEMNLEQVISDLNEVQAGIENESLKSTIASVIEALPTVVAEKIVEVPADEELIAKASLVEDLEGKVAEATERAEKAEADLQALQASIEAEKVEAEKVVLASARMEELTGLGVVFSEARQEKVIAKLREMDAEAYADYKEELTDALASVKVEEVPVVEEVQVVEASEQVEINEEDKAIASLNIETPEVTLSDNPYKSFWSK